MGSALEYTYLRFAIIYAGASYRYFFGSRDSTSSFLRVSAYHETLKKVREAILETNGQCSEAMLLAIAILAIHGSPEQSHSCVSTGPQYLKDLEYYGSKTWEPTHFHALMSLTKQRGGLSQHRIQSLVGIILTWVAGSTQGLFF